VKSSPVVSSILSAAFEMPRVATRMSRSCRADDARTRFWPEWADRSACRSRHPTLLGAATVLTDCRHDCVGLLLARAGSGPMTLAPALAFVSHVTARADPPARGTIDQGLFPGKRVHDRSLRSVDGVVRVGQAFIPHPRESRTGM